MWAPIDPRSTPGRANIGIDHRWTTGRPQLRPTMDPKMEPQDGALVDPRSTAHRPQIDPSSGSTQGPIEERPNGVVERFGQGAFGPGRANTSGWREFRSPHKRNTAFHPCASRRASLLGFRAVCLLPLRFSLRSLPLAKVGRPTRGTSRDHAAWFMGTHLWWYPLRIAHARKAVDYVTFRQAPDATLDVFGFVPTVSLYSTDKNSQPLHL